MLEVVLSGLFLTACAERCARRLSGGRLLAEEGMDRVGIHDLRCFKSRSDAMECIRAWEKLGERKSRTEQAASTVGNCGQLLTTALRVSSLNVSAVKL